MGFPSNTDWDPLESHKAAKLSFNVGQSSAFQWWADGGQLSVLFGSSLLPSLTKTEKNAVKVELWIPSDKKFRIHTCLGLGPLTRCVKCTIWMVNCIHTEISIQNKFLIIVYYSAVWSLSSHAPNRFFTRDRYIAYYMSIR